MRVSLLTRLSQFYYQQNQLSNGLVYSFELYTLITENPTIVTIDQYIEICLQIAKNQVTIGNYQEGLKYYLQAINEVKKQPETNEHLWRLLGILMEIWRVYQTLSTSEDGGSHQLGEVINYDEEIAYLLIEMGHIHRQLGQIPDALTVYREALRYREKIYQSSPLVGNEGSELDDTDIRGEGGSLPNEKITEVRQLIQECEKLQE